jgi:hypothetical protein
MWVEALHDLPEDPYFVNTSMAAYIKVESESLSKLFLVAAYMPSTSGPDFFCGGRFVIFRGTRAEVKAFLKTKLEIEQVSD